MLNGTSYDYYVDRENTSLVTGGVAAAYWGLLKSASTGVSQTIRSKKVVSIPPKTSRFISEYTITRKAYDACELRAMEFGELEFTSEDSPVKFGNIITYAKDGGAEHTITHSFYVKSILNIDAKDEQKKRNVYDCRGKKSKVTFLKDEAPSAFYLQYERIMNSK